MIDTHAHLNEPRFAEDVSVVRHRAREAGVSSLILVGYDLPSSRSALELAELLHDAASVGVHPHDAEKFHPQDLDVLRALAASPRVVALGEIGLDFHYDNSPREVQRQVFREQIRLAKQLSFPLIMHCREAYADQIRILSEEDAGVVGGVAHCFFGTAEEAEQLVELGFYLGVGGGVTFPKSVALRETLKTVPKDRILLETDCPYMAPVPHRGKRNEPAFLPFVAERLAELWEQPVESVVERTTENALACFPRLKALPPAP